MRPVRAPFWRKATWWAQYAVVRAAAMVVQTMPVDFGERVARTMGRVYRRLDRSRWRTALENVRIALGDRYGEEERRQIALRSFEHAFVLLFEVVMRHRIVPNLRTFRSRSRIFGDEEKGRDEVRAGRGGFVLTGHFGSWEAAGARMAYEGTPFTGIARAVPNPYVQDFLMGTREKAYAVVEKTGAVDGSLRLIRRGGWVAVLGDQNAGRHGVFIPFFGVPASTYPFVATLAAMYDLTVFFGVAIRRGPRFRYDFHLKKYEPPPGLSHDERKLDLLESYHRFLEEMILLAPEQYFWMHRRWKTRPIGEAPGPHLPEYDHRRPARAPIPIRRRVGKLA